MGLQEGPGQDIDLDAEGLGPGWMLGDYGFRWDHESGGGYEPILDLLTLAQMGALNRGWALHDPPGSAPILEFWGEEGTEWDGDPRDRFEVCWANDSHEAPWTRTLRGPRDGTLGIATRSLGRDE